MERWRVPNPEGCCWNMLVYRKSYFGICLGFWISSYAYSIFRSHFHTASFMLGCPLKYADLQKNSWASVWDSELQQAHIQMFSESQFYDASFLLGLLLRYAGSQKIIFWASVWDSGFLGMYTWIVGESQLQNVLFSVEASAEIWWFAEIHVGHLFRILDCSGCMYKFLVNLKFITLLFY